MNPKLEEKIKESEANLSLFDQTKNAKDLARAVKVRNVKHLHDTSFLKSVTDRLLKNELDGYDWYIVLEELIKSYEPDLSYFVPEIKNQIAALELDNKYVLARDFVNILHKIGEISNEEFHFRLAMLFLEQGLQKWNEREENTFYPNISSNFKNAYKEIYKVRNSYPEETTKIKEWYATTQRYVADCIRYCGINCSPQTDEAWQKEYKAYRSQIEIRSVGSLIAAIQNLPYISQKDIDTYLRVSKQEATLELISTVEKLGPDGQIEGRTDSISNFKGQCHYYWRETLSFIIYEMIKEFIERELPVDSEGLNELMEITRPSFVPAYVVPLIHLGFTRAFEGKYIEMSYVLMPQVEAMLRSWAQEFCGNLTRLDKETNQDEANLTKSLACLKPHWDPTKFDAVNLFLNESVGVNLRNKMSHGLMKANEVKAYAQFLLKIAIDLYFNHETFLKKSDTEEYTSFVNS